MQKFSQFITLVIVSIFLTSSACNKNNSKEAPLNQARFPDCTCDKILDSSLDTWVEDIIEEPNIYGSELKSDVFDLKGIYAYELSTGDTIIHILSQHGDDNGPWNEHGYATCDLKAATFMYEYTGEKTLIATLFSAD